MTYDAIVIGAGAMGSAAAYYFANMGQKTLLLEQFELNHKMGSSYGYSRIIRYAYDHPAYIALAHHAFALWHDLEVASGEQLLVNSGGLDLGHPDNPRFAATRHAMQEMNIPFEELSAQEVMARFPQFHLPDDFQGLFQAQAGILKSSLCIQTHVRLAQQLGVTFQDRCKVEKIIPSTDGVTVETNQGTFSATRLVITAGAWAGKILHSMGINLPLQPTREQLVFFDVQPAQAYLPPTMPISINWGRAAEDEIFYSIPDVTGNGFKAARHFSHEPVDPDSANRTPDQAYIDAIRGYLRQTHPEIADCPVQEALVCLYTMTPDEHFVIDQLPGYPHISVGAGFSGHGFKFSTLIGKILAEMASQQPLADYPLDLFKIARFA